MRVTSAKNRVFGGGADRCMAHCRPADGYAS